MDSSQTTHDSHALVVAIDIGTTYSGYAYSFANTPESIQHKPWYSNHRNATNKTPTAVLLDKYDDCIDFGYGALHKYSTREDKEYRLFNDRFKLEMEKPDINRNTLVHPMEGKKATKLIYVVASALKYLYGTAHKEIAASGKLPADQSLIRIVLTVPAMWSENSISFMRDAALHAGIVESAESPRLFITLEPAAASFVCRDVMDKDTLEQGTEFMVVDCGGGTVDIAVNEVHNDGRMKEMRALGEPWGGGIVNYKFETAITRCFGDDFVRHFISEHYEQWLFLNDEFEIMKRNFKPEIGTEMTTGALSSVYVDAFYTFKKGRANRFLSKLKKKKTIKFPEDSGLQFIKSRILIAYDTMQTFHEDTVRNIVGKIRDVLLEHPCDNVRYVFVVGGFSESSVLFPTLFNALNTIHRKVIKPSIGDLATLKGAVLYGHAPAQLTHRSACRTYGHGVSGKFVTWIEKHEPLALRNRIRFILKPPFYSNLDIFASDKKRVTRVDENGVQRVKSIKIPIPSTHVEPSKRMLVLYVTFESTKLLIRVVDPTNADQYGRHLAQNNNIDFDCQ